jgi:hypothetical protein
MSEYTFISVDDHIDIQYLPRDLYFVVVRVESSLADTNTTARGAIPSESAAACGRNGAAPTLSLRRPGQRPAQSAGCWLDELRVCRVPFALAQRPTGVPAISEHPAGLMIQRDPAVPAVC